MTHHSASSALAMPCREDSRLCRQAFLGLTVIRENDRKQLAEHPAAKVLSYRPEIKDVQVVGDLGLRVVRFRGQLSLSSCTRVLKSYSNSFIVSPSNPLAPRRFICFQVSLRNSGVS